MADYINDKPQFIVSGFIQSDITVAANRVEDKMGSMKIDFSNLSEENRLHTTVPL